MSILGVIPIVGSLLENVLGIIDKAVPDKDLAGKLKHEVQLSLLEKDYSVIEKELSERARVIVSEATGQSWIQRNWRPITMLVFVYIIAHNYIFAPVLRMFFPQMVSLEIPPDMWDLLKLGIGGYIVGRSAEKIVREYKEKYNS